MAVFAFWMTTHSFLGFQDFSLRTGLGTAKNPASASWREPAPGLRFLSGPALVFAAICATERLLSCYVFSNSERACIFLRFCRNVGMPSR